MRDALKATARAWLAAGRPAMLVQVLEARGSVPREAGTRMLVAADAVAGTIGAYFVAVSWLNVDPGLFFDKIRQFSAPDDLYMGLVKAAVFGFLISAISCRHGFYASGGAKGVGLATTRAVVQSAVAILISNYIITSWMS